jgi:MSHA biogenesis protein MshE
LRAALTGHLVLSTLHTNDAASTPIRLMDMGVPRYMVSTALQVVLAQRLVRLICESCSQPAELTASELEWLKQVPEEAAGNLIFQRGRGCAHCNGTGYNGRTGVYEMLEVTQEVANAANNPDPAYFLAVARKQMAGHTLRSHAVVLARMGKTTIGEAMRISNQLDD